MFRGGMALAEEVAFSGEGSALKGLLGKNEVSALVLGAVKL